MAPLSHSEGPTSAQIQKIQALLQDNQQWYLKVTQQTLETVISELELEPEPRILSEELVVESDEEKSIDPQKLQSEMEQLSDRTRTMSVDEPQNKSGETKPAADNSDPKERTNTKSKLDPGKPRQKTVKSPKKPDFKLTQREQYNDAIGTLEKRYNMLKDLQNLPKEPKTKVQVEDLTETQQVMRFVNSGQNCSRQGCLNFAQAGQLLLGIKKRVKEDKLSTWDNYCKQEFKFSYKTADRYINFFKSCQKYLGFTVCGVGYIKLVNQQQQVDDFFKATNGELDGKKIEIEEEYLTQEFWIQIPKGIPANMTKVLRKLDAIEDSVDK